MLLYKKFLNSTIFIPTGKKKNFEQKYPPEQQFVSCSVPALRLTADFARVFHFKGKTFSRTANLSLSFQDMLLVATN